MEILPDFCHDSAEVHKQDNMQYLLSSNLCHVTGDNRGLFRGTEKFLLNSDWGFSSFTFSALSTAEAKLNTQEKS